MADVADDRVVLYFGDFVLDPARACLREVSGREIPLRPKSFDVLLFFVLNAGRVVTKGAVLDAAWPNLHVTEDSIVQCVRDIRRALQDEAGLMLRTVPRKGYILDVELRAEAGQRANRAHSVTGIASLSDGARSFSHAATGVASRRSDNENDPSSLMGSRPERRQITILQCRLEYKDIVSTFGDPEELKNLLQRFHLEASAIVTQARGTVAKLLVDGALFYFGYPQADEHQAERAVRAALDLVEIGAAHAVKSPDSPRICAGVASSVVLVGNGLLAGSEGPTALGEAAETAARLCGLAGAGNVLISDSIYRLLGNLFQLRRRPSDGISSADVTGGSWEVLGRSTAESRSQVLRTCHSPLVGRDEEIEILLRRWSLVKARSGRVVLISSEPGGGKSRLAASFAEQMAREPHFSLHYSCSPYHQDDALYPLIDQLGHSANFQPREEPAEKLAKLYATLASAALPGEEKALIADLLGLPSDGLAPSRNLPLQRQRERTLEALLRHIEGLALQRPALIVFDDVHWIDPSSRELLDRLIERIANLPILLLVLFRPEFHAPWVGQPHVTVLTLPRLDSTLR